TVEGKAISYAGAPLSDAKVQWYVEREVQFPYFFGLWGRSWFYDLWNGKKAIIGKGETTTGPDGRYRISFTARPDTQVPKEEQPLFSYRVHAEVTDLNGETHPAERFVQAAYSALRITVGGAAQGFVNAPFQLELATTNLSGEPEPSKGEVTVSRLADPERLLRPRLFYERPDRSLLDKTAFVKQFPHDPYGDEERAPRPKEKEYLRRPFDTGAEKKMTIDNKDWPAGDYLVEVSAQDKFGQPVTTRRIVPVRAVGDGAYARNRYDDIAVVKESYEPGETAEIIFASAADAVTVVLDILRGEKEERTILALDRSQKVVRIPVTESDRGNIAVRYLFLKHGRSFMGMRTIAVPWTNKQLSYEFLSFRSTLKPGEKEEWRIKLKGAKGEAVAAELAATLYDGSLDAFLPHQWAFSLFPTHYYRYQWLTNESQQIRYAQPLERDWNTYVAWPVLTSDAIHYFGMYLGGYGYRGRGGGGYGGVVAGAMRMAMTETAADEESKPTDSAGAAAPMVQGRVAKPEINTFSRNAANGASRYEFDDMDLSGELLKPAPPPVQIRKNLQETAFFYPQLMTDEKGETIVSFTVPEALTTWKMIGLAHTKELESVILKNELKTQKELMVAPNMPRFLREGDRLILSAKISNMTDAVQTGSAELKLLDARTMNDVGATFALAQKDADFTVPAKRSGAVKWEVTVPRRDDPVVWRIVAKAGDTGDGEENILPILSDRMLVTETMPLPVNGREKKAFTLEKLKSNASPTLVNHRLTLEFTSNPAWYAVQALPYLIEYPYECAEQVFSRFYANSLATHIVKKNPKIEKVFAQWKGTPALDSNLMKNEELKSALLQETPWVLDAQDEAASKRRIALLFDLNRMAGELKSAFDKLRRLQVSSGGWPWFPGLPEDRYITQHITAGLGKLKKLGVAAGPDIDRMTRAAVGYLDRQMERDYQELLRAKVDMTKEHISYIERHYLYTRSFFTDIPFAEQHKTAFNYWKGQATTYWLAETPYMTALTATALFRFGDAAAAAKMIVSLKERAIYSDELGMYWKENMGGYYWYQLPIETQAALIEAFEEVAKDGRSADKMKTWLIKMKQVQNWRTTKATADAVYALLHSGTDWLSASKLATVTVGGKLARPAEGERTPEAGTGYFKTAWPGKEVTPAMAQVTVENPNPGPAWGALYWQYFENLDKITADKQGPLALERQILREKRTDSGAVLEPITEQTPLTVGDKIAVRIVLKVDRDMEYLHLKDARPAGTEPVEVLSGSDYRDGLWYYRVTKDVSTNFFIHRAVKGTYVLEYRLTVTIAGNYSAGLATAQCMYAPEFAAHSAGLRLTAQ
ncbi:MAG TPA: alpha-2-macroglobulin family protein, partial [bacterium]|nr:alpha-2-macroglobulin family protein [bacterium]